MWWYGVSYSCRPATCAGNKGSQQERYRKYGRPGAVLDVPRNFARIRAPSRVNQGELHAGQPNGNAKLGRATGAGKGASGVCYSAARVRPVPHVAIPAVSVGVGHVQRVARPRSRRSVSRWGSCRRLRPRRDTRSGGRGGRTRPDWCRRERATAGEHGRPGGIIHDVPRNFARP